MSDRKPILTVLTLAVVLSISPMAIVARAAQTYRPVSPIAPAHRPIAPSAPPTVIHHPGAHKPKICPIKWRRGPAFVQKLIRCAAIHWHVPGGPRMALFIAWRESHYRPFAYNPSGAEGIYQHMRQYWPARASSCGFANWSAFNGRANVIVTMRMVRAMGNWGPWGG